LTFDLNYIEWESKDRRKDTKVAIAAVEKISFGQVLPVECECIVLTSRHRNQISLCA